MDITPQDDITSTQPISDDQELAKALAGITDDPEPVADGPTVPAVSAVPPLPHLPFEETPLNPTAASAPTEEPAEAMATTPLPTPSVTTTESVTPENGSLDSIKKTALEELRPLMDKVELPAEEKFDTYLMLIRSTDDSTLIAPAHAAAQEITDEKRKAQALLDIIKEIDFLSHATQG